MVNSFAELELALRTDYDLLYNLPPLAVKALHNEVQTWEDYKFKELQDMFNDYFNITDIPVDLLKDICLDNVVLAFEVYCGATRDTAVRDTFSDMLLKKIDMTEYNHWPCYGDTRQYSEEFFEVLPKALEQFGMKIA